MYGCLLLVFLLPARIIFLVDRWAGFLSSLLLRLVETPPGSRGFGTLVSVNLRQVARPPPPPSPSWFLKGKHV